VFFSDNSNPLRKISGEKLTEKNRLSLISWNSRSLNRIDKLAAVMRFNPHIACIQECWNPRDNILNLIDNEFLLNSRGLSHGGGTLSWWKPSLNLTKKVMIEDSSLLRFNMASELTFWIANCYINKKSKMKMLNLFKLSRKLSQLHNT